MGLVGRAALAALAAVVIGLAPPGAQGGPSAPTPLHLVYAQPSAIFAPLFVAQDEGLFARQGLTVTLAQATGSSAVAPLLSGASQALWSGATEVAGIDAAGGDVLMLATGSNYPVFSLYVNSAVRTVQDLVGRRIAVTQVGTLTDTAARLFLEYYGLTGKVEILTAGGTMSGILASMKVGIAAGGIVSPPTTVKAEEAGFRELINGVRLGVPMVQAAVAVRRSYLVREHEAVLRLMKAYLAAWAFLRNPGNAPAAERAIAHYTQSSQDEAAVAYSAFLRCGGAPGCPASTRRASGTSSA